MRARAPSVAVVAVGRPTLRVLRVSLPPRVGRPLVPRRPLAHLLDGAVVAKVLLALVLGSPAGALLAVDFFGREGVRRRVRFVVVVRAERACVADEAKKNGFPPSAPSPVLPLASPFPHDKVARTHVEYSILYDVTMVGELVFGERGKVESGPFVSFFSTLLSFSRGKASVSCFALR